MQGMQKYRTFGTCNISDNAEIPVTHPTCIIYINHARYIVKAVCNSKDKDGRIP